VAELKTLSVRSIMPDPMNPRFDLGDLTAMTADIRADGLIEPLVVRPGSWGRPTGVCQDCDHLVERLTTGVLVEHSTEGIPCPGGSSPAADDWYVVAGHRRLAASKAAGLREVDCVVNAGLKTKADVMLVMVRENGHRRDLTALEEAHAYEQLHLEGLTTVRIAEQTRKPKKQVERRVRLLSLAPETQEQLKTGQVTLDDAEALLGLPPDAESNALRSVGTREFRQEVAREHLALVGDATDEAVAARLRDDFLAPFLTGGQQPHKERPVMREIVAVLAANLPRRTVRDWAERVGVTDPGALSGVPTLRALLGLAVTVEKTPPGMYQLLDSLGYATSPLEETLLAGA